MKTLLISIALVLVSILIADAQLASDSPAPVPSVQTKARMAETNTRLSSEAPIVIAKDTVVKTQVLARSKPVKLPSDVALINKKD